ncbi:MAG TPA: DUF2306 domain-containing protein [Stellaceae bacterium]|nr:DUF2306 domain-containing protein [Stellaceae bacterium]
MPISSLSAAHVAAAFAALVFGALVLLMRKGTSLHRAMGSAYTAAMIVLCIAALLLYRMTGRFGPFHILAVVTLVTIGLGIKAIVARPRRLSRHYQMMTFSYLGLLSAATTQLLLYLPALHGVVRGTITGIASAVAFTAAGAIILPRLQRRALARIATD